MRSSFKKKLGWTTNQLVERIISKSILPLKYHNLVVKVLQKIPRDDLKIIHTRFERFVFYEAGSVAGATKISQTCPNKLFAEEVFWESIHEVYIIDLIEENLKLFSDSSKMAIIAHELTPVYCNHDRFVSSKEPLEDEDEADEMVKKWGFKRELQALLDEQKNFRPPSQEGLR
jgi:predicted metallopeptidase